MFSTPSYIIFEFIFVICLPLLFIYFFPHYLRFRHLVMVLGLVYILLIISRVPITPLINSFSSPSLFTLVFFCLIPSLICSWFIIYIHQYYPNLIVDKTKIIHHPKHPKLTPLIAYPLLSVTLQEIIFRWFYVGRFLNSGIPIYFVIIVTAVVFGLVHLPFGKPALSFGTFIAGLWWNSLYLYTGNIWYPLISHAILGNTLIWIALYPEVGSAIIKYANKSRQLRPIRL